MRPPSTLSTAPVLWLEGFGVAFQDRLVLAEIDARVPPRGVCALMGPSGGGKSTLLRTLSGANHGQPDLRHWGRASYLGQPLEPGNRPVLVQQDMRYFTSTVWENLVSSLPDRRHLVRAAQVQRIEAVLERAGAGELAAHLDEEALALAPPLRRLLSVVRAAASGSPLICVDEPTAGLHGDAAAPILNAIRSYAKDRAVLLVTHHQGHAREVADHVLLLAGGRIQESTTAAEFFATTSSPIVRRFLDTGGIPLPRPDAAPETLSDDAQPPPELPDAARVPNAYVGPRDFRWLVPGRLGGMPRPGIVASLEEDLQALIRLGVQVLVTVEEVATVPTGELAALGVEALHFPLEDMAAPTATEAAQWCQQLEALIQRDKVVAIHCRAGQGRTGTLLACYLIWTGTSAIEALDRVRGVNPKWVTSDAQVRFLARFEAHARAVRA